MPVCALHLVELSDASQRGIETFISTLLSVADASFSLITVSKVESPIIRATLIDHETINNTAWTLLIVASGSSPHVLPAKPSSLTKGSYAVISGIPGKIVSNYDQISNSLRQKAPQEPLLEIQLDAHGDVVPPADRSGSSRAPTREDGQDLSLSPSLLALAKHLNHKSPPHRGAVSMLNLLHFHTAPGAVESYHEYGRRFATVAGKRGGNAKLVGVVISPLQPGLKDARGSRAKDEWWNECTLVHYPSINHFIDMSVDDEYQHINQKYRLNAIKDTALICTTEIDLTAYRAKAKL